MRLRDEFAPGGLLHYGQGKWYPGESLPRWASHLLLAHRRRAAVARSALDRRSRSRLRLRRRCTRGSSRKTLARRLGIDPEYLITAYEDPLAYLHERAATADQRRSDGQQAGRSGRARAACAASSSAASRQPIGFVLPLQRGAGKNGPEWQTGMWMLRAQHLFLMPGDSPVGLRLAAAQRCRGSRPDAASRSGSVDPMAPADPLPVPQRRCP